MSSVAIYMWAEELNRNRSNRASFRYHIFPEINTSKNRLKLLQYLKANNHHILNFQAQKTRVLIKAGYWRSAAAIKTSHAVCLARQLAQVFVFRLTALHEKNYLFTPSTVAFEKVIWTLARRMSMFLTRDCNLSTLDFKIMIIFPGFPFPVELTTTWKQVYYLENFFNFIL